MTLLDAISDPKLFGPWFKDQKDWLPWRAFIAAVFGLPLDKAQREIFKTCTGRNTPPKSQVREAWCVVGRRGGKSMVLATIAVFLACFGKYKQFLQPGERGTVMIIAADRAQARIIFRYVKGFLDGIPMLKRMVEREVRGAFDLKNQVTIEIATASSRKTRGYTTVCILADEIAFWNTDAEGADPDTTILEALRPSMLTIPTAMLLCASSPYSKRGAMWDAYSHHFGKDESDVLVWQAPTERMHPSVNMALIRKAYDDDPVSASAEYGAQFRNDIDAFVSREVVEAATIPGRVALPPAGNIAYVGFADAAGGSGGDSFTAAICHLDHHKRVIIDAIHETKPPFSPEQTIGILCSFFKPYRVFNITTDRWGGEFPVEQFRKFGITCVPSEKTKSDLYNEFLPLLNSSRVELPDLPRLTKQLIALERRTSRTGKDSIDHPPGGHDDVINSVAGAAVNCSLKPPLIITQEMLAASRQPANRSIMSFGKKPPCYF